MEQWSSYSSHSEGFLPGVDFDLVSCGFDFSTAYLGNRFIPRRYIFRVKCFVVWFYLINGLNKVTYSDICNILSKFSSPSSHCKWRRHKRMCNRVSFINFFAYTHFSADLKQMSAHILGIVIDVYFHVSSSQLFSKSFIILTS